MNYEAVTNAILKYMGKKPSDHGAYTDLLSACRQWEQENFQAAHAVNGQLKATAAKMLRESSPKEASFFYENWRKSSCSMLRTSLTASSCISNWTGSPKTVFMLLGDII